MTYKNNLFQTWTVECEQPSTLDILLNLKRVVFGSVQNSEKVTVTTTVTRRRQVSTVKDESKRLKNHCIIPHGIYKEISVLQFLDDEQQ